jgi:hypothetical protein
MRLIRGLRREVPEPALGDHEPHPIAASEPRLFVPFRVRSLVRFTFGWRMVGARRPLHQEENRSSGDRTDPGVRSATDPRQPTTPGTPRAPRPTAASRRCRRPEADAPGFTPGCPEPRLHHALDVTRPTCWELFVLLEVLSLPGSGASDGQSRLIACKSARATPSPHNTLAPSTFPATNSMPQPCKFLNAPFWEIRSSRRK